MSRVYAPLCAIGSSLGTFWQVGVIDNHEAKPLTFDEVKVVCDRLNGDVEKKLRERTGTLLAGMQAILLEAAHATNSDAKKLELIYKWARSMIRGIE